MEYLDPKKIKFIVNIGEVLNMEYEGVLHTAIKLKRCFPLKMPDEYISVFCDDESTEIGIIKDLKMLDETMYEIALNELKFRYFMPKITKISKLKEKRNLAQLEILTDAGKKSIAIQDIPFNINSYPNGQVIIRDVDGNLYEMDKQYLNSKDKNAKFIKNYI